MTWNESDWWYIPIVVSDSAFLPPKPVAQQPISWKGLCSLFSSHTLTARRKRPLTIFTQKNVGWIDEGLILYFFVGDSESFDIDTFQPQTSCLHSPPWILPVRVKAQPLAKAGFRSKAREQRASFQATKEALLDLIILYNLYFKATKKKMISWSISMTCTIQNALPKLLNSSFGRSWTAIRPSLEITTDPLIPEMIQLSSLQLAISKHRTMTLRQHSQIEWSTWKLDMFFCSSKYGCFSSNSEVAKPRRLRIWVLQPVRCWS